MKMNLQMFATNGNYVRKHYLGVYTDDDAEPTEWLRLGRRVSTITDDSTDETDTSVFYDSEDGNPEEVLLSRPEVWTFEGQYTSDDPAHKLIKEMRRVEDDKRKVWHKIEETDGSTVIGLAKIFDPVAGGGEASGKEILSGRIAYIKKPKVTEAAPTEP